jgi:hypothetical protein
MKSYIPWAIMSCSPLIFKRLHSIISQNTLLTKLFVTKWLMITVFGLKVPYPPVDIFTLILMWSNHVFVDGSTHHIEIVMTQFSLVHVYIWAVKFLVMLQCIEQIL